MKASLRRTARRKLWNKVKMVAAIKSPEPPMQGWLKAIREALGMTSKQVAHRLSLSQVAVINLEKREGDRSITLKSLEKSAHALNCRVVYFLVPLNECLYHSLCCLELSLKLSFVLPNFYLTYFIYTIVLDK